MMDDSALSFYDQLADSYHLVYQDWRNKGVRVQGEVLDRLIKTEAALPPRTVLDCSCGIGTQAIGLALRGYQVHATDLSPRAVERARREADNFGVEIDFGVADFRTLETQVDGTFEVVLSCDNSLPHLLTDEDLLLAARNMWSKVQPGGLLLVGIRDYDQLAQTRPRATTPEVIDGPEGRRIVFQIWDWAENGRTYSFQLFIVRDVDGRPETQRFAAEYRALLRGELTSILGRAGFTDIRWHLPSETGYIQPIVSARKRPERTDTARAGTPIGARLLPRDLPRAMTYPLLAGLLLIAGTLSFILQALADGLDARPGFVAGCAVVALATLLLSVRSAGRGDDGAASAWGWFAVPFALLLGVIVLPFARLSTTLGLSSCDPANTQCRSGVLGFWLALLLFAASAVLTVAGIRALKGSE